MISKNYFKMVLAVSVLAVMVSACEKKESPIYALTTDDNARATANAKQFFGQDFPIVKDGVPETMKGVFVNCNPTDSNANGLVTCTGKVPNANGSNYVNDTQYCGYDGKINGCQVKDTAIGSKN